MICVSCGHDFGFVEIALCPHHLAVVSDQWALGNRIMCDFVHRRIAPERVIDDEPLYDTVPA